MGVHLKYNFTWEQGHLTTKQALKTVSQDQCGQWVVYRYRLLFMIYTFTSLIQPHSVLFPSTKPQSMLMSSDRRGRERERGGGREREREREI